MIAYRLIHITLVCAVLSLSSCNAQIKKAERPGKMEAREQRQKSIVVENLITDARTVPAEFAADSLLSIVELGLVKDPDRKTELLEEAFRRAAEAQQQVRRVFVGGVVDTRPGYMSYAFDLKLDALSLRSRAIKAMLEVDKKRARAMVAETSPKVELKPLDCDDKLVYDVSEFYDVMGRVAQTAFTPKETLRGQHVDFVELNISNITSTAQVEAVVKMILSLNPTPAQLSTLLYTLSKALRSTIYDDRSFSYSVSRSSLVENMVKLVRASEGQGALKRHLLEVFREYLVKNLRGPRCADNVPEPGQKISESSYISYVNSEVLSEKPISADELLPEEIKIAAKSYPYWQTPEAKQLNIRIKKLRFGSGKQPLTVSERNTVGWQDELNTFLADLNAWDEKKEKTEADYFHQRSVLYEALLDLVPPGPNFDTILLSYISYLRGNYVQRESRIEWFWHVNNLIGKASRSNQGEVRSKVFEALRNSGVDTIRLYVDLADIKLGIVEASHLKPDAAAGNVK